MKISVRKGKLLLYLAAAWSAVTMLQGCGNLEPEREELSDTVRWFNASYAILTELNGWDYNIFAGLKPSAASQRLERASLEENWGVTDRKTADETLEWVLTQGHRAAFREDIEYLSEIGLGELEQDAREKFILENFDVTKEDAAYYVNVYRMYEEHGEQAVDAWDYCRGLNLLSFYYLAGFYTEEEALDRSLEIAGEVQPLYDSWDDMVECYLRGYEYWAAQSSDERRGIYEDLLSREDNPYAVDYHTALEKTW